MTIDPINRAFPDRSLLVSYEDCVRFARAVLSAFPHGALKPWAVERDKPLNYTLLITLKNGKLTKPTPNFIQRILSALSFNTELVNLASEQTDRAIYFRFKDESIVTQIREKLNSL